MNYLKLSGVLFALAFLPALRSAEKTDQLVGNWEGNARVSVQWCGQSELLLSIDIAADGSVTGKVGDAVLVNGQLKKKSNWFGSRNEHSSSYIVEGDLKGAIVESEGISREEVFIHLRIENSLLCGSLATNGSKVGGKERMALSATPLRLCKVEQ